MFMGVVVNICCHILKPVMSIKLSGIGAIGGEGQKMP